MIHLRNPLAAMLLFSILVLSIFIPDSLAGEQYQGKEGSISAHDAALNNIQFIENTGQIENEEVRFYIAGSNAVGIGRDMVQFSLVESTGSISTIRLRFLRSHGGDPIGIDPTETLYHFFYGMNPDLWKTGIRSYREVVVPDLYNNIDLRFYGDPRGLKYDLIVHPGGDPDDIRIAYEGADDVYLEGGHSIHIECGNMKITDGPLEIFQETQVQGRYMLENGKISIEVDEYDETGDLLIDPLLLAASYFGGNDWDRDPLVRTDPQDRPVMAGTTESSDLPTTVGAYSGTRSGAKDVMIAKFSKDLSTLYSTTYFGGTAYEYLHGLEVSQSGKVFIAGYTNSANLPTTPGSYQSTAPAMRNCFITCFDQNLDGLYYSTFIGGSRADYCFGLDVDSDGSAYITGHTYSNDYPNTTGAYQNEFRGDYDAFLTKMTPDGISLEYSTFIGGADWGEKGYDVVVNEREEAIIAGHTISNDFPTTMDSYHPTYGYYMGFITKFTSGGDDLIFSTYFGNGTWIYSLDLGPDENIYMTGMTVSISGDFPVTQDAADRDLTGKEDAFFSKLSAEGSTLLYSTFLGADEELGGEPDKYSYWEEGHEIVADDEGRAYLVGRTDSMNFPTTNGALDRVRNEQDGFITIYSPDGTIEYSSFIGGRSEDNATGIALNSSKGMYISGDTYSNTPSHDFPVTDGSYQTAFDSAYDSYLTFFKLDSYPPGPPTNLAYTSEDSFINLTWNPPIEDGGEEIISYRVYRGNTPSNLLYMDMIGSNTFYYNDTSVTNGRVYHYGLRAENVVGRGEYATISAAAYTTPEKPQVTMVRRGDMFLNISWNRPYKDGGLPDLTYNFYLGPNPDELALVADSVTELYHNRSGLTNGQEYYYAISALNSKGEGELTDPTLAIPMWVPSEPRNLIHDITPFKVHLNWEEPSTFRGDPNVTYNVYMGPNLSSIKRASSDINVTLAVINTPEIGVPTLFFVRAKNQMGEGQRSAVLNLTPLGDLSRTRNLTATELGNSILLQWKRPEFTGGAPGLTYDLLVGPDEWNLSLYKVGIGNTTYVMSNVVPGRTYFIGVRANNSYWQGPLSDIVYTTPYNPPSEVLELTGTIGDSYVNLSWREPLDLGGDANVSYEIFMSIGGGDLIVLRWLNSNRTMVRSLENGVDHTFAVRAYNVKGPGPLSDLLNLTPMTVPSPPRNLIYTEDGSALNLTWDRPLSLGGAPSITYTLLLGRSRNNMTPVAEGLEDTVFLLDGLKKGELYMISVFAVNIIGGSERSNIIEAVPMTVPSPPRDLSFNWTEQGLRIRWKAPMDNGGGDIWYFHIFRGTDPANMTLIKSLGGSFFSYLDPDAEKDTTYHYRIRCENSLGSSPLSNIMTVEAETIEDNDTDLNPVYMAVGGALILIAITAGLLFLRNSRRRDWPTEE